MQSISHYSDVCIIFKPSLFCGITHFIDGTKCINMGMLMRRKTICIHLMIHSLNSMVMEMKKHVHKFIDFVVIKMIEIL